MKKKKQNQHYFKMKPKIALCTILKNEESCVLDMLKSAPVQAYYIVDTGSTDGTIDIVREFLKDKKGKLIEKKWRGFAENRNQAVRMCEEEYCLQLDADEIFHGKIEIDDDDMYGIYITEDKYEHFMGSRLFKKHLRYKGVIHETVMGAKSIGTLYDCHILHTKKGKRSIVGNKFKKDMEFLDERMDGYGFYMGETYRYLGDFKKAIECYHKGTGIYVGICIYRIAQLTKGLEQWAWYMYGFNASQMLEHLYFAVRLLRQLNHKSLAGKLAKAKPVKHSNIFYIPQIHDYLFDIEVYHLMGDEAIKNKIIEDYPQAKKHF